MASFTTACRSCSRKFKTLYSLKKHATARHEVDETQLVPIFESSEGGVFTPPKMERLSGANLDGYKIWLAGLVERINSLFHPRLPGRWVRVDSHQVPKKCFQHLLHALNVQVNAVRDTAHKAQPSYKSVTRRVSYKLYDAGIFWNALEQQNIVTFDDEIVYSGNDPISSCESGLTAEQEIENAKLRASHSTPGRKRLSSKSSLIVGIGEGRATREIELIWWPDLYSLTENGRLVIRMYIEKCNF